MSRILRLRSAARLVFWLFIIIKSTLVAIARQRADSKRLPDILSTETTSSVAKNMTDRTLLCLFIIINLGDHESDLCDLTTYNLGALYATGRWRKYA